MSLEYDLDIVMFLAGIAENLREIHERLGPPAPISQLLTDKEIEEIAYSWIIDSDATEGSANYT